MQRSAYPPLPCLPFDVPVYRVAGRTNSYVYDDRTIDYDEIEQAQRAGQAQASLSMRDISDQTLDEPVPLDYGTNLWLDIADTGTNSVLITAHNVDSYDYFQLFSRTNILGPDWMIEQQSYYSTLDSPYVILDPVPENGRPEAFFWAAKSKTLVWIVPGGNAIRPSPCYDGQNSVSTVFRSETLSYDSPLTVWYRVSGTATNGVDYTYLTGSVIISNTLYSSPIEVNPLASLFGSNLTVTLTLVMTSGYLVDTNGPSATVLIEANVFSQAVSNVYGLVGLDYHPPTQSLLVSLNPDLSADTNFLRIATNGVASLWADVAAVNRPVTIATVKKSTNGFVEGDMYFGTVDRTGIGWLSADGARSSNNWVSLSGYLAPVGGLYVDQTGVFGGDLIAVTGGDYTGAGDPGSVWRINSSGNATLLAELSMSLGGVITLTNDVAQWGP